MKQMAADEEGERSGQKAAVERVSKQQKMRKGADGRWQ